MQASKGIYSFFSEKFYVAEILFTLLGIILLHGILKIVLSIIKARPTIKNSWKEQIDFIVLKPTYFLIWTLGIGYIISVLAEEFGCEKYLKYIYPIGNAFFVAIFTWFVFRWKKTIETALSKKLLKRQMDSVTVDFLGKMATVIIIFISFLLFLQALKVDVVPLIAFGGVGAAAIGFAAKDVIANFFGGLMVYITRPFKIGDLVEMPKEGIFGQVENIGWYLTTIRNTDKRPIYVPNAIFSTAQITNDSRRTHRKIEERIGIRFEDFSRLSQILKEIREFVKTGEKIDQNMSNLIYFDSFQECSLELYIRAYIHSCSLEEYFEEKQQILMKIYEILSSKGARMPFPTREILLSSN